AIAVGADGALYIADYGNARIRKVVGGVLSTIAGGGTAGSTPARQATFSTLFGVAVDNVTNDVYFADYSTHKVYRVTQSTDSTNGTLEVVAGTGSTGFNGDQSDATQATLWNPYQIHIRGDYLYIADSSNDRVRRVNIRVSPRPIETIAGTTSGGFSGDEDAAVVSKLSYPASVFADAAGDVYISDRSNQRIRKVTASNGKITTLIGDGTSGFGGDGMGGRGVVIRAEVASGGPNYRASEAGVQVQQSRWTIDLPGTSQS